MNSTPNTEKIYYKLVRETGINPATIPTVEANANKRSIEWSRWKREMNKFADLLFEGHTEAVCERQRKRLAVPRRKSAKKAAPRSPKKIEASQ